MKSTTRTMIILLALFVTSTISVSCNKKHDCQYDNMTYNKNDKRCECIQPYASSVIPALSNSEFNTCEAVVRNFIYLSVDNADYPYYSHAGDTIKFCGYVKHSYGNPLHYNEDNTYCSFTMIDDYATAMDVSNYNGGAFFIESSVDKMVDIDLSQKCYVTGVLAFGPSSAEIPWVNVSEPGTCHSAELLFHVIDIHN